MIVHLAWIMLLIILTPCSGGESSVPLTPQEIAWLNEKHTVRVRIGNAPPFMLTDGNIRGIAIDYLTAVFNRHGIDFRYVPESAVTWPQALDYISQHDVVDMVPTAKITEERKRHMLFTSEYIVAPWVIFTRSDADFIGSIDDLNGKTVSVEEGYVIHEKLTKEYPGIHLKVVPATLDNYAEIPVRALSTGVVDAYIGNLMSTTYLIQSRGYTNVKVAAPAPFDNHNQAMAIRNDWLELVSIINKTLASMTPDEHAAIRNRWLSIRFEYGIRKTDVIKWLLIVGGVASLIIGFVLIWNKRLKTEVGFRKKIERDLKKSENRFRATLDATPFPTAVVDLQDERIFFWSRSALTLFGHIASTASEWYRMAYPDPEYRREVIDRWKNGLAIARESSQPVNTGEYQITCKDGSVRICDLYATFLPENLIVTFNDITTRKQAEEDRIKLLGQLQQTQKLESIGTLAGGIAHDFNNILSAIIGFTELALDDVAQGTPLADNLQEIFTAGTRAKELVKQILAFARQSDEARHPIRVDTIAREVLKLIRATIPSTVEIRQDIASGSLIMGNPTQVNQVLMNLCTNAAQAMEEGGGTLTVSLADVGLRQGDALVRSGLKSGDYLKITVADTGYGVDPGITGAIFEPFFTTKGVGEGTGMGLAMVYGIVESYAGKVTVASEPGKETVFSVYLPIIKGADVLPLHAPEQLPTGDARILLVDDEAPIAKLGALILERLGYSVTTRTSSVEALELFRVRPDDFDLIVTDMTMPTMTGDRLAMELMKIRPDIPVILCTGYSRKISDESAAAIGIKAFAFKPIVKADLSKTVRKVLDEAKSEAQG